MEQQTNEVIPTGIPKNIDTLKAELSGYMRLPSVSPEQQDRVKLLSMVEMASRNGVPLKRLAGLTFEELVMVADMAAQRAVMEGLMGHSGKMREIVIARMLQLDAPSMLD